MLVTAGHDALNVNPKFRSFLRSLGHAPPPVPPAAPVATSDENAQHASAE
jgi:hypothetical protein